MGIGSILDLTPSNTIEIPHCLIVHRKQCTFNYTQHKQWFNINWNFLSELYDDRNDQWIKCGHDNNIKLTFGPILWQTNINKTKKHHLNLDISVKLQNSEDLKDVDTQYFYDRTAINVGKFMFC